MLAIGFAHPSLQKVTIYGSFKVAAGYGEEYLMAVNLTDRQVD